MKDVTIKTKGINSQVLYDEIISHLDVLHIIELAHEVTYGMFDRLMRAHLVQVMKYYQEIDRIDKFKVGSKTYEQNGVVHIELQLRYMQKHCLNFSHIEYIIKVKAGSYYSSWRDY